METHSPGAGDPPRPNPATARAEPARDSASSGRRPRRLWFPLAIGVLVAAAMVAFSLLPPDQFDRGMRVLYGFIALVVGLVAECVWFFFMAGLAGKTRLTGALLLAAAAILAVASVRRVEFSGDMDPTFDLRWQPDRTAVLEAHRARQNAAASSDSAAEPIEVSIGPLDVLEYRGARRDGIVEGPRLARDWSVQPPKLVWRQPVGGGYASFVVAGPLVITIEQRRDNEAVVAYDVDTGRERWVYQYPAAFSEKLGGDGPRATPTIHEGKVYSLGATGVLACLELASGRKMWTTNILEQNRAANLEWAMSGSPLIYDGAVIVNPGDQQGSPSSRAIVAFDAADGKRLWSGGEGKASYASPMLATLAGTRQLIIFDGVGLSGNDATDGRQLWRVSWKSDFDINAAQPVLLADDQILISSQSGAALIKIALAGGKWSADTLWNNRKLKCGYSCPIVYQGHVYGIDESILACLEVSSGKQQWKDRAGQYGHGQMLLRDELLVVLAESGVLALVEATPERFHELGRIQAIDGKTWNNPTLVGRRIFVRNHLEMVAYDLPIEP